VPPYSQDTVNRGALVGVRLPLRPVYYPGAGEGSLAVQFVHRYSSEVKRCMIR
jgi:hypothetical protein